MIVRNCFIALLLTLFVQCENNEDMLEVTGKGDKDQYKYLEGVYITNCAASSITIGETKYDSANIFIEGVGNYDIKLEEDLHFTYYGGGGRLTLSGNFVNEDEIHISYRNVIANNADFSDIVSWTCIGKRNFGPTWPPNHYPFLSKKAMWAIECMTLEEKYVNNNWDTTNIYSSKDSLLIEKLNIVQTKFTDYGIYNLTNMQVGSPNEKTLELSGDSLYTFSTHSEISRQEMRAFFPREDSIKFSFRYDIFGENYVYKYCNGVLSEIIEE